VTFEPLTPERRRAMTREHLMEAAAIVFARDGFHGATLDEVAATAGFTKGAVYSNFKSKDDLFLALLDDRIDRQFAVVTEVLDEGPDDIEEDLTRIRALFRGPFFWSDEMGVLYLEFVLYAMRNPAAQKKLAASAERSRARIQELIEHAFEVLGKRPRYPTRELAEISHALFEGLSIDRLIDPSAVSEQIVDTTLSFMNEAMDAAAKDRPPEP
jgi:AcrR family transcriptional regulator